MMFIVLAFVLATASQPRVPSLGQTRQATLKMLGTPASVYSLGLDQTVVVSKRSLVLQAGPVADQYNLTTPPLRMRVQYITDRRVDHGFQHELVSEIQFAVPSQMSSVELLRYLPITAKLCAEGCSLLHISSEGAVTDYLFPKVVTPAQRIATAAAGGEFEDIPKLSYVPALKIISSSPQTAVLGPVDVEFEKGLTTGMPLTSFTVTDWK